MASPSQFRVPGLLLDQARGGSFREISKQRCGGPKNLADSLARVDRFEFAPPDFLEFGSGAAPSLHPLTHEFAFFGGVRMGHRRFQDIRASAARVTLYS